MTYQEAKEVAERADDAGLDVSILPGYMAVFSEGWTTDYNLACNEIRSYKTKMEGQ